MKYKKVNLGYNVSFMLDNERITCFTDIVNRNGAIDYAIYIASTEYGLELKPKDIAVESQSFMIERN